MAIPEATLENWSHQGSVQQSAATYQGIKGVLEDGSAPYSSRSISTFLQGSYGNNTNIRSDSDVDVVIYTDAVFYYDLTNLDDAGKTRFEQGHPGVGAYTYADFKKEVADWLRAKYGQDVRQGTKATLIRGNGSRRDADVLPAVQHRHYWSFPSASGAQYAQGIVFWKADGTKIVNYPKQHSENCTNKHQRTASWFKPTVRVFKNMRNRMVADGFLEESVAPSYYIEGLLSNAADTCFGHSFERTFAHCVNYLSRADIDHLKCANGIHWLVRDGAEVCWSSSNFSTFMRALPVYWANYTRRG
ncbi:nucleotidyltransferase [Rhizobium leguminosarum]|uniref:nucleotidyltransferase domain-containing protein n=1 Tax=Rhizobium leguminosarum TaxID=384 RepID=UPI003F95B579